MALPQWLQILETIGPTILLFTPLAPITPFVVGGIHLAEQIPGASGEQKKAFAMQIAALAAQATNVAQNKITVDPAVAPQVTGSAIDTIVGVTNLVHRNIITPPAAPTV